MTFLFLIIIITVLVLVSCGGGSSSSSPKPIPNPNPLPQHYDVRYGYFMGLPSDLPKYASKVDYVFTPDWGDWDSAQVWLTQQALTELQQAKQLGIKHAVMSIGYLVFSNKYEPKGTQYLTVLKTQLEALDLDTMVDTFYVIDEPDLRMRHGLTLAAFKAGLDAIKSVFPDKKLMVIYSNSGDTPCIQYFDYVGKDDYTKGSSVLNELPNISNKQAYVLVPGGANPFRNDPQPFAAYASSHSNVAYVVAFLYSDYPQGLGIGNNGMLDSYEKAFGKG